MLDSVAKLPHVLDLGKAVGRWLSVGAEKREASDLSRHAARLLDGARVELREERAGVEEEQVLAESGAEDAVSEKTVGERFVAVASLSEAGGKVFQEMVLGREPDPAEPLKWFDVPPGEAVEAFADCGEWYVGRRCLMSLAERWWVTGGCSVARRGGFGVGVLGVRAAAEDAARKVLRRQDEHPCVPVEGAAPGDHPVEPRGPA